MVSKFFIHPASYSSNGKWICPYCGKELPVDDKGLPITRTEWPCTVSVPIPFDSEVEISVWNCRAKVLLNKEPVNYDRLPRRQAAKLERLAIESVERVGGAINWSGIYPPSEELCKYIEWLKKRGTFEG